MKKLLAGILALVVLLAVAPVVAPSVFAPPAFAQMESREAIALQNQILALRHDMELLRDRIARGGSSLGAAQVPSSAPAPGSDMTATLLDRVSRLEAEVRSLRGQLDEAANAAQQQNADLSKRIDDLDFKVGLPIPETGTPPTGAAPTSAAPTGALPTGAPPTGAPIAGAPATGAPQAAGTMSPPPGYLGAPPPIPPRPPAPPRVRRTPELAMQEGSAALARRDYTAAEAAAREVLAVPHTPRAYDAQFLLAEALAGKRDYRGAAVAYDDAYARNRTGPRAPDSLLGLAGALTSIGQNRAACATLDKLQAEFPHIRQDLRQADIGARRRAGCH